MPTSSSTHLMKSLSIPAAALLLTACATVPSPAVLDNSLNRVAPRYVALVLAVGQHDEGYVDAYYGPAEWQTAAASKKVPLDQLALEAAMLRTWVQGVDVASASEIVRLRKEYLDKQLGAVGTRIAMLRGQRFTFDEESRAL